MKDRDRTLFVLFPGAIALLVILFAVLFGWLLLYFERSYLAEAEEHLARDARLAARVVQPLLEEGKLEKAREFCASFRDELRLSLIDAAGKVEADSAENAENLASHLERKEVKEALSGEAAGSLRYSTTLNQWMIYHAVHLKAASGDYVLRAAVSTARVGDMVAAARIRMILALGLGAGFIFILMLYLYFRVRVPLTELQQAAGAIAGGELSTDIAIPERGVIRELALEIDRMAGQLKQQLRCVTAERNEKEAILNGMEEAVLLFAGNGDLVRANQSAQRLFRLAEGGKFNIARAGVGELPGAFFRTEQSGEPFSGEYKLRREGGAELSLYVRGVVIEGEEGRFVLLTVADWSERRKLESFRSDFVANVSHEIRTPLTGIIAAAETLREEKELPPEQTDKLLDILYSQSLRLNALVRDILSLADLEHRALDPALRLEPTRLDMVLEAAVDFCRPKAQEAGVRLVIVENQPIEIPADGPLLEQAISNLVNNAVAYSGSERVELSLVQRFDRVAIEVRDFGAGIGREHHERLFQRFYRVHKERSRAKGGTGLGLAIVKHIARLHHGTVELESAPGQGCLFRILLPR